MGWLTDLISETSGPRGSGTPGTWGSAIGRTLENFNRMDPEYARRREAEQLLTGRMEHQRLTNALLSGQVDEQTRTRAEREALPGAERDVLGAYGAREPVVEWGDEEGAGVTRTAAGRTVAKSVKDLLERGVQQQNVGIVARQSPDLMKALGFQSPADLEAAEMETANVPNVGMVRKRSGDVVAKAPPPAPKLKVDRIEGRDGYYYVVTDETTGRQIGPAQKVEGVDLPSKTPNLGERNETRAASILRARGIVEGSPEWDEGMYVLTNPTPSVENVGIFSRLDALGRKGGQGGGGGGAPAPRIAADRPLSTEQTRSLGSLEVLDGTLAVLERAASDPQTKAYRGPIGQWLSTPQRWATAVGMANEVPGGVVDLEQNLAVLNTETRRAATGAQMSAYEIQDIQGQLPRQSDNPQEFGRRLQTTKHNIGVLKQMAQAGLTEQQRAKLRGSLIGVRATGQGGGAAPAPATSAPTVIRWGRDANGRPVRLP